MNYLLPIYISIFLIFCSTTLNAGEDIKNFTRAWLEKCCLSIMVGKHDPNNYTKDQEDATRSFIFWINGFMVGANSMCMAPEEGSPTLDLAFPPQEWLDAFSVSTKILEFCKKNPEIPPNASAREVVMIWYYLNHPKSTDYHKDTARHLLIKLKDNNNSK